MTRSEFVAAVEEARRTKPLWFDLEPDRPPTDEEVRHLEEQLGASLPEDYVWFLTEYGGGDFAFTAVYSADPESSFYAPANQPTPARPDFVAIGDDGTGNYLGFPVADGQARDEVVLLNHENEEIEPTSYGRFLRYVARTGLQPA